MPDQRYNPGKSQGNLGVAPIRAAGPCRRAAADPAVWDPLVALVPDCVMQAGRMGWILPRIRGETRELRQGCGIKAWHRGQRLTD